MGQVPGSIEDFSCAPGSRHGPVAGLAFARSGLIEEDRLALHQLRHLVAVRAGSIAMRAFERERRSLVVVKG